MRLGNDKQGRALGQSEFTLTPESMGVKLITLLRLQPSGKNFAILKQGRVCLNVSDLATLQNGGIFRGQPQAGLAEEMLWLLLRKK